MMFNWLKKKNVSQKTQPDAPGSVHQNLEEQRLDESFSGMQGKGNARSAEETESSNQGAQLELAKLHSKMDALAQRFASGSINRAQFQDLFSYYQSKASDLATLLYMNPDSEDWKNLVSDGQSIIIRKRHAAKLNGFSIIDHRNGMPLRTIGEFGLDPALFVPMLYAYQSATKEIFGGSLKSTQIEDGRWLVFVSGQLTTTLALFSNEPAQRQQQTLQQVHKVFEAANEQRLKSTPIDIQNLVVPHEYFLNHSL